MRTLLLAALLGLLSGCHSANPEDDLPPMKPLPAFHPPQDVGPESVPPGFRYPKRIVDGGLVLGKVDAG